MYVKIMRERHSHLCIRQFYFSRPPQYNDVADICSYDQFKSIYLGDGQGYATSVFAGTEFAFYWSVELAITRKISRAFTKGGYFARMVHHFCELNVQFD